MLAYAGSIRGHQTIDEAIADPSCRSWVEMFWDEASRHLTFPAADIADYRAALLTRFSNPRVRRSAGPDRSGRVDQAAGAHAADDSRRASSGTCTYRLCHHCRRLGAASARAGRTDQGRRSRCRSGGSQFW